MLQMWVPYVGPLQTSGREAEVQKLAWGCNFLFRARQMPAEFNNSEVLHHAAELFVETRMRLLCQHHVFKVLV